MRRIVLVAILASALSSCAPYVMVGGKYTAESFEVDLPNGWRKHELAFDPAGKRLLEAFQRTRDLTWDEVRITRDGLTLQQIGMGKVAVESEIPHTKRRFAQGMRPQEAAEVVIDSLRSHPGIIDLQLLENDPAVVAGQAGFKLLYAFKTKTGLKIKAAYYGVMQGNWHYYIVYEAPERHYFEKDYSLFEKIKDSLRIRRAGTA